MADYRNRFRRAYYEGLFPAIYTPGAKEHAKYFGKTFKILLGLE